MTPAQFLAAFAAATAAVAFYGGASDGDRTILDALNPAAKAAAAAAKGIAASSASAPLSWAAIAEQLANGAEAGAEATRQMGGRAGRSSYVNDADVLGTPDPGAKAAAYAIRAVQKAMKA